MTTGRPSPVPDELSAPFWEAARDHRLVLQQCEACGNLQHPPRYYCQACGGESLTHAAVSGRGRLTTYGVVRQSLMPGYTPRVPYIFGVVELAEQEGLRMQAIIQVRSIEEIAIGDGVSVVWETLDGGAVLPQFAPVEHR